MSNREIKIDTKMSTSSAMAAGSDDDEWIYLDPAAEGLAYGGGSAMLALASDAATEENEEAKNYIDCSGDGRLEKASESDEELDVTSDEEDDDDDGSRSDEESQLSDYSNEGGLEKVYLPDYVVLISDEEDSNDEPGSNSGEESHFYSGDFRREISYDSDEDLNTTSDEEEVDDDGEDDYFSLANAFDSDDDDEKLKDDDDDYVSISDNEDRLEEIHESDEVAADGAVDDDVYAPKAAADDDHDEFIFILERIKKEEAYLAGYHHGYDAGLHYGCCYYAGGGTLASLDDDLDLDDDDSSLNGCNDDRDSTLCRAETVAYVAGHRLGSSLGRHYGYGYCAGSGDAIYGFNSSSYHAGLFQRPAYYPCYVPGVDGMYPHYMAAPHASPYGGYFLHPY